VADDERECCSSASGYRHVSALNLVHSQVETGGEFPPTEAAFQIRIGELNQINQTNHAEKTPPLPPNLSVPKECYHS
jgi:hypothetical protein